MPLSYSTESFRIRTENYVYKILVLAYSEPATDYVLIEGQIAFYRHCSVRNSILWSFLKISFPPMGICTWSDFWLQNCARPVVKYIIPWWQRNSVEKQQTKYYWSFALPLSTENWFKSCEYRHRWLNHHFKSFGSEKRWVDFHDNIMVMMVIMIMMTMMMMITEQWHY